MTTSSRAAPLLGLAFAAAALAISCGARSDLPGDADEAPGTGGDAGDCAVVKPCGGSVSGTYILTAEDGARVGRLFFFDGSISCGGSATAYLLVLELMEDDRPCSRSSDLEVITNSGDDFVATADNHGGSFGPICGGDPGDEAVEITMRRLPCEADRFEVSIRNSEPGSPYTLNATAERCRCELGWEPCVDALPEDVCAP